MTECRRWRWSEGGKKNGAASSRPRSQKGMRWITRTEWHRAESELAAYARRWSFTSLRWFSSVWRLCALTYAEQFTYRSLYAECHAGFWLSVAHNCVRDACLRSGAACGLCCGRRWRGAGGEEIDGTSRCLFMVATDPVTLGPMRNWPPDRGGVGRSCTAKWQVVPAESEKPWVSASPGRGRGETVGDAHELI